jgi:KDO2-lipid IV(A) lauroyltransferase
MTLVSSLLAKTNAVAVMARAERLPNSQGFKLVFQSADEQIYSKALQESVAGLNRSVEQCIAPCIEQYQWEYKRFKQRPGKKRSRYTEYYDN